MPVEGVHIDLSGQVALVTGGAKGIGRSIAETLLEAGCQVVVCGRNAPESLPSGGGCEAVFMACDVRAPDQVVAMVDAIAARFDRLDIVVNNAGGSPLADASTASPRFSDAIVALNLMAPLHVSQAAHKYMQAQPNGGSIVNICSVSGIRPSPGTAIYGAAKAGLLNLTQSLAMEWGPKIRVNAIIVGLIATEGAADHYGAGHAAIAHALPLKRMGQGRDIANAVLYLSSPLASYVSGARLSVDGGGERPSFLDLV
ncbi:SDR family oxidoreductase [Brevundimonas sp. BH3]|uniref:SDR family oxidoreductase n=1 Tax=Brevundimonas sp. BH3 TaxID=3133089 RepID=UPI003248B1F4